MQVGFIGLGTMGARMAGNLQKAGYKLVVNDLRKDAAAPHLAAGAVWADTPRALAAQSDVILTSLPEPPDVEKVALARRRPARRRAGAAPPGSISRPTRRAWSRSSRRRSPRRARTCSTRRCPAARRARRAASSRSGSAATRPPSTSTRPVLDAIGDQARYIGPIGSATVAKLVHNMSGYAIVCALAETFAMGVKAGVEPLALWEAVRQGAAGRRYTFDALINQWLPGKYDPPDFALKLAHKDVGLATALGRELGLPMRICELAYAEMTEAMNRGWAGARLPRGDDAGAGARRHRGQGRSRAAEGGAGDAVPGDAGGEEVIMRLASESYRSPPVINLRSLNLLAT